MCYDVQHNKVILNLEPDRLSRTRSAGSIAPNDQPVSNAEMAVWHGPVL
jgi:hypothetical protein